MNTGLYINPDDPKSLEIERYYLNCYIRGIEEMTYEPKPPLNRSNGQMAEC